MLDSFRYHPAVGVDFTDKLHSGIPKIENRSIHLAQLNQITNYLLSLADEHGYLKFRKKYLWNRLDPECAEPLQFTTMTFYDLVDWVILPLTEAVKCSFVEVAATGVYLT